MKKRLLIILMLACASSAMLAMESNNSQVQQETQEKKYNLPNQKELDCGLSNAAWMSPIIVTKRLLDAGANPNYCHPRIGITPLMYAANYDRSDICRLLLHHGAHTETQDTDGNTALMLSAKEGVSHARTCKAIIDFEAAKTGKRNTLCLLMTLNRMKKDSHPCATLLYTQRNSLLKPHLQNIACKPLELLRIKNNLGLTAFDFLPLKPLDPEEENKSPVAVLSQAPNKMAIILSLLLDQYMPAPKF